MNLADALDAAAAIGSYLDARTLDDFLRDRMLRRAVEREFEVLGEALKRALSVEPRLAERVSAVRGAIDFRNVIAHDYDRLSAEQVHDIATWALPGLATELEAELARRT